MKIKSVLCLIAAFLLVVPSLLIPGIVSFSDESAEETLFFSSFEDGEDHAVSCKTLESSGVKPAEYGIKGKGLAIDLSTVDGSVDYVGNENKFNLFDAKTGTKFLTEDSYVYVQFALEQPAKVTSYEIVSANDASDRDPRAWTLYASDDGVNYVPYDEQKNVSFTLRFQTKKYEIASPEEHKWFRLVITENAGSSMTQFSGLELYAAAETVVVESPVALDSIKGTADLNESEIKRNLFDSDEGTKCVVSGTTMWVSFKMKEASDFNAYSLTSANDAAGRDPRDFTLYGSNDGENWTGIDSQTGVTFSARLEKKSFALKEKVNYLYYKLDVTKNNGSDLTQLADIDLFEADETGTGGGEGLAVSVGYGPMQTKNCRTGAWTGIKCLQAVGEQTAKTETFARVQVYEGLNIPVAKNTVFSYYVFPGLFNVTIFDYEYTPCRVIVDLHFTDGTVLSALGAEDQHGSVLSPTGQANGECLYTAQWNYVESEIGAVAQGKTIDRIDVFFEMPEISRATKFLTFFDDVKIENRNPIVYSHLSDYINILRGTNNDGSFSRGLCTPGVTVPNGFNFYSPVTNPSNSNACYNYMVNGANNPLDSISVMHTPSNWLGSYGTWQFMANTSVDPSGEVTEQAISSDARRAKFSHDNEIARAHYYSVLLDEGSAASGVKIEVTPTSHAAYVRFTFPEGSENVNVIFDSLWSSQSVKFDDDGRSFSSSTSHNSAGSAAMKICGSFDVDYSSAVKVGKLALVSFPAGTKVVTMKIATSFLKLEQARHNLELEIGNKTFDEVFAAAQKEWDDLCGKFEIEGATYSQLTDFYSCLYRLYAYPMLYSENEGTNEEPEWVYASPYKNGRKTKGVLYTVNGFWDTYRTTWAAYSLFTENKDTELLNGLVQHYTDSGWIPRWICPGGVDCMVGTSSDIIFADAYIKGIDFDYEKAWESMIENSSAYSTNMSAGGRPNNNTTPFLGYVPNSTTQGYSSSMEGYINDYGLYRMAEKMGKTDEAAYYLNRCLKYKELFNPAVGFFMGKNEKGVFSATTPSSYDPASWGGPMEDYTESVGWVNAFPAVFDGDGLANLYGGREALAAKLDQLFDDSPDSMRKVVSGLVHEADEFKEVKMGQYEHNNQPSHHLIYTYAFSSEPYKVQQYTREVLRHVYVGSEIGQGYPGDEDNGEMSGWFIFNALGFYPYALASGEYVISSPLFDKVTVHLDNGKDLTIIANNNSKENVFIKSATVNGQPYDKLYLTHEQLAGGATIVYEMDSKPSSFGSAEEARPTSVSDYASVGIRNDVTDGATIRNEAWTKDAAADKDTVVYTSASGLKLFDGNMLTVDDVDNETVIVLTGGKPSRVEMITLSCDTKSSAPKSIKVEVSNDGENWRTVLENDRVSFTFNKFLKPFALPEKTIGSYMFCRLTLTGGTKLAEVEFIGSKGAEGELDDPFTVDQQVEPDTPTPTPTPSPTEPDNTGDFPSGDDDRSAVSPLIWLIPAIAGAVLLAAGVVVLIIVLSKKKR